MSIPRTKLVRLIHDDLLTEDTLKTPKEEQDQEASDPQSEQSKDDSQT